MTYLTQLLRLPLLLFPIPPLLLQLGSSSFSVCELGIPLPLFLLRSILLLLLLLCESSHSLSFGKFRHGGLALLLRSFLQTFNEIQEVLSVSDRGRDERMDDQVYQDGRRTDLLLSLSSELQALDRSGFSTLTEGLGSKSGTLGIDAGLAGS